MYADHDLLSLTAFERAERSNYGGSFGRDREHVSSR